MFAIFNDKSLGYFFLTNPFYGNHEVSGVSRGDWVSSLLQNTRHSVVSWIQIPVGVPRHLIDCVAWSTVLDPLLGGWSQAGVTYIVSIIILILPCSKHHHTHFLQTCQRIGVSFFFIRGCNSEDWVFIPKYALGINSTKRYFKPASPMNIFLVAEEFNNGYSILEQFDATLGILEVHEEGVWMSLGLIWVRSDIPEFL